MDREKTQKSAVVIGAGPVGIATAAQLLACGIAPTVLEKGETAGSAISKWGHVHVFTPWRMVFDDAVLELLKKSGWSVPNEEALPSGKEIVEQYLIPAASVPELRDRVHYNANVIAVSKRGLSKSSSRDRDETPFTVHYTNPDGGHHVIEADAVEANYLRNSGRFRR